MRTKSIITGVGKTTLIKKLSESLNNNQSSIIYSPIGYFVLPEHCWLDNYYRPMQNSFAEFLNRNGNSEEAQEIVNAEKNEISLYEKYKVYYSYGVYVARKIV